MLGYNHMAQLKNMIVTPDLINNMPDIFIYTDINHLRADMPKSDQSIINKIIYRKKNKSLSQIQSIEQLEVILGTTQLKDTPDCLRSESALQKHDNRTRVDNYLRSKADILASKQLMVLDAITPDAVDRAKLGDVAMLFDKLNMHERLQRGESTSNISMIASLVDKRAEDSLH
jgi:hypothetical protein